jgi:hypothetical protein
MLNRPLKRAFVLCIAIGAVAGAASEVAADSVTDWSARAVSIGAEKRLPTSRFTRALAIMHLAMFEAVNAVDRPYKPYTFNVYGDTLASRDAAAGAAAHTVLASLFPDEQPKLDQALQVFLAALSDDDARAKGVELGKRAAAAVIALRADDGASAQEHYRPYAQPGAYVPTTLPAESTSGAMKPWVMEKGSQFRPAPPPALNSEVWTRDVNEIRELGSLHSKKRTTEQTEVGRFWLLTGPRTYLPLVQQVADARKMPLVERARLYALISMATSDAMIAVFDAKYAFNFWRPITAIRNADLTSNPATRRDASWVPLGPTPMHPEYPCAHCIVAGAMAEVLQTLGGGEIGELTLTNAGITRKWTRLDDYSNEVSLARIYAGFHYRFSTEVGKSMGKKIGELVVNTQLLSLSDSAVAKR